MNNNNILLVGYYGSAYSNFGDMCFEHIFSMYLRKKYDSPNVFVLQNNDYTNIPPVDIILLGGGEIINPFFMIPLFSYIEKNQMWCVKIVGASIGYDPLYNHRLLDFMDACIFRNSVSVIDHKSYFLDTDVVFDIDSYIPVSKDSTIVVKNTIGVYVIDELNEEDISQIRFWMKNHIRSTYRFIVFDLKKDIPTINKIVSGLEIDYEIVIKNTVSDIIREMLSCEKHLCMRFHSHVICEKFGLDYVSFPCTTKVRLFNQMFGVPFSKKADDLERLFSTSHVNSTPSTSTSFNWLRLQSLLNTNNSIDKRKCMWYLITHIYNAYKNRQTNIQIVADMIEYNFLGSVDTKYRYGIVEKLLNRESIDSIRFCKIITDIIPK